MKILHVLATDRFSGAENVVCQIIHLFRDSEYHMAYCSRDGEIRKALEEKDVLFIPIHALNISELRRVIKAYKPDIIHAHDMRMSLAAAFACGKIPLISHIHNDALDARRLSVKSVGYIWAAVRAKKIIWVAESAFRNYRFRKPFAAKSTVLPNVLNAAEIWKKMRKDTHDYSYDIVFLGRLSYPKDPIRLLSVLAMVAEKKPDVRIAVIGTGELEQEVHKKAADLNLLSNITFLGYLDNPYKVLHDAKVMIMTSIWEGTPMCALEAMALGVPIVSTPVAGLRSLVINGKNGYLCHGNDELALQVFRIISDEALQKKLSDGQLVMSAQVNDLQKYKESLRNCYESCSPQTDTV